jgi:hypothetical protein
MKDPFIKGIIYGAVVFFASGFACGYMAQCQEVEHGSLVSNDDSWSLDSNSGNSRGHFAVPEEPRGIVRAATPQVQGATARQVGVGEIEDDAISGAKSVHLPLLQGMDSSFTGWAFSNAPELRAGSRMVLGLVQQAHNKRSVVDRTDLALDALVIVAQVLDYASTQDCISKPYRVCHEAQLPAALVANKPAFAALKGSEAALEIWGMHRLEKRHPGMRTMARVAQVVNVGLVLGTDGHNYVLAGGEK